MVKTVETARVTLWDHEVGAVSWLEERGFALFEYNPSFLNKGLNISPLQMGLEKAKSGNTIFSFPGLNKDTYLGLPGLLSDSLPDKFGNRLIDVWLAQQGRDPGSFSPVERLCYTGERGMGALHFYPAYDHNFDRSVPVEISELVKLAQSVMTDRLSLDIEFGQGDSIGVDAITDILRVGTSAGGARPKAIIAMNNEGHVVSGQTIAPPGYDYWILKFDGVSDLELGKPKNYGRIEYAYYLMATAAGIDMMECRLLEENGRAHFLTKRFDRKNNKKIHVQSLCGLAHYDYNMAGGYSYEQVFAVMRKLQLSKTEIVQQYRRAVFNVVARNQDDHTKNIAFLMDQTSRWRLSPAFDVIYSHNPHGQWTNQHQMSINGKRDKFLIDDLLLLGDVIGITKPGIIIDEIISAVLKWPEFSQAAGLDKKTATNINQFFRILK